MAEDVIYPRPLRSVIVTWDAHGEIEIGGVRGAEMVASRDVVEHRSEILETVGR